MHPDYAQSEEVNQKVLGILQRVLEKEKEEHEGDIKVGIISYGFGTVMPSEESLRDLIFLVKRLSSLGEIKLLANPIHHGIDISVQPYPIPEDWYDLKNWLPSHSTPKES